MKVIFLSHSFPPQAAPRAVQVARLAKYSRLPIRVLCASAPCAEHALREAVEVLGFPDRSPRLWRLAKHFLYLPDSERPWADRLARTVLAEGLAGRDDVLVTFGQPMSDHLAGLRIKRRLGLPWIAHFSDPWSDNPYLSQNPISRLRLRNMERQVFGEADRLLFTSPETVDLVMRKYPGNWRDKTSVLPHAYDPQLYRQVAAPREGNGVLTLRYVGNFYGQRNPLMLIEALALLLRTQSGVLDKVRIELVGRWVGHEHWSPAAAGLPTQLLTFHKSVGYAESLRLMCKADALLIIDAPFEHNVFFPSKLVDYLGAGRPILALTPPGATADIVTAAGGVIASPANAETMAEGLANLIGKLRHDTIGAPSESVVARYDVRRIATVFDELVLSLARNGSHRQA
jgi:glycosyltransferase involved in cell wall biosynthesis